MEKQDIYSITDHTRLNADASYEEIKKLCQEAVECRMASVCIPPSYVKRVHDEYGSELRVCTVVGFPLGYSTADVKVFETECAVRDGADEIDVVINIGDVKNGDFERITGELRRVRAACSDQVLKVIVETCCLTKEEKIRMCSIVTEVGADFIKTSTGFGSAGATLEDIVLFRENIGKDVKIKAAGGIRRASDFKAFYEAGCDRIGASGVMKALF